MKRNRFISLLLAICLCLSFSACGDQGQQGGAADVDLTKLSSTMVYAEVYNMITNPEKYIGKTVKMKGEFAIYYAVDQNGNPVSNAMYFACVVADATSCCSQGIEFVLSGDHTYPDDYPEMGSTITVSGEFQTYRENGYEYIHLINATMSK
jgi:hypothetical protein